MYVLLNLICMEEGSHLFITRTKLHLKCTSQYLKYKYQMHLQTREFCLSVRNKYQTSVSFS